MSIVDQHQTPHHWDEEGRWVPKINSLPQWAKNYIMWLETNADPAHTLQENYRLVMENAALRKALAQVRG